MSQSKVCIRKTSKVDMYAVSVFENKLLLVISPLENVKYMQKQYDIQELRMPYRPHFIQDYFYALIFNQMIQC